MQFDADKWKAAYKKAVSDMSAQNMPTSGIVCAVATLRVLRDGLIDDIAGSQPIDDLPDDDQAVVETIRDSFAELLKHIQGRLEGKDKPELAGFASNASAAAKAAGYKTGNNSLGFAD